MLTLKHIGFIQRAVLEQVQAVICKVKARLRKGKLDLRGDVFEMGEIHGFRDSVIHDLGKMQHPVLHFGAHWSIFKIYTRSF